MIRQSNVGGGSHPEGQIAGQILREVGDLRLRKIDHSWSLKNFLKHRRREVRPGVAMKLAGWISSDVRVHPAELQLRKFSVTEALKQDTARHSKLQELLAKGVDVRTLTAHFPELFVTDYGVVSRRVVTTAGVNYLVDSLQGTTEPENLKFHGYGTGTNAEATGNTALQTELTTEYATDNTRPTGSQGEGATANVYRTTATLSPDTGGTLAITEHGIFSANAAGTLLDRSVFSAVNIVAGADSLQTQYDLTLSAGG